MKLVSTLALLLWMSCYLNCSFEQIGLCAESSFASSTMDQCPHDGEDNAPKTCADSEHVLLTQQTVTCPALPAQDLTDPLDLLSRLLAQQAMADCIASGPVISSNPEVSLSEQDCTRVSRPIRGPNV